MATSGTSTFTLNRSEMINAALRIAGVVDPEVGTASTNQLNFGGQALNTMLKSFEGFGLQLWERQYGVIFPQKNQMVYVLGSPGPAGDHACLSTPMGTGFVSTTLSAAAASGASTITVTTISTTGTVGVPAISMLTTWYIGIKLDGGTRQWTTINGAPSGTTVTLTATLTGAAASGNSVIAYATKLTRPLRILDGFTRQSGGNDIPHLLIARDTYNRFGVKTSSGMSIQSYYDPQRDAGYFYTYPTTSNVSDILYIEFQKAIEDITGATDNFDVPQEWMEPVKWQLAYRLGIEYGTPSERLKEIKELAFAMLALMDGWDQEPTSLFLQPNNWMYASPSDQGNK